MTHKALHFVVIATKNLKNMIRSRYKWFWCRICRQIDQRNVRVETENPFKILHKEKRQTKKREKNSICVFRIEVENPYKWTIHRDWSVIIFITLHIFTIVGLNFLSPIHHRHWLKQFHPNITNCDGIWQRISEKLERMFVIFINNETPRVVAMDSENSDEFRMLV